MNHPLLYHPSLDQPLLDRATRPVAPTFVWWTFIELRLDKMSNEGVYNVIPRTKIRFGGFGGPSRAIRKIQIDAGRGVGTTFRGGLGTLGVLFLFPVPYAPLFITFRFVDSTLLLENETHFFLLPFSKDLTSGHETIVFGR